MTASCSPPSRVNKRVVREVPGVRCSAGFRIAAVLAALTFVLPVFAATHVHADMDLDTLGQRLSATDAVGIFTKLTIKGKVDILYRDLKAYHAGRSSLNLKVLKERFLLMVQGIVLMVQNKDPELARDVSAARKSIWAMLADPESFRSA